MFETSTCLHESHELECEFVNQGSHRNNYWFINIPKWPIQIFRFSSGNLDLPITLKAVFNIVTFNANMLWNSST